MHSTTAAPHASRVHAPPGMPRVQGSSSSGTQAWPLAAPWAAAAAAACSFSAFTWAAYCIMLCTAACTLASRPPTSCANRCGSACWMACSVSAGEGSGVGGLSCVFGRARCGYNSPAGQLAARQATHHNIPHHTTPRHATPHHARPPSQPKPAQASLSLARLTRKEDEGVDCVDGALHLLILVLRPVLVICRRKHTHPCNPDSAKGRGVRSGGRCLGAGVRGSSTATRLVLDRHMRRGRAQAAQKAAATPPALPAFRLPSQHPALHVI